MCESTFSHGLLNTHDSYMHIFTRVPDTYFPDLPVCESILVMQFYKSNATSTIVAS